MSLLHGLVFRQAFKPTDKEVIGGLMLVPTKPSAEAAYGAAGWQLK